MSSETAAEIPRPLRCDAELNRQRILVAARNVFARRGLDATLDEVAEHAGLGVGTVYRRFANKDDLIDSLLDDSINALVAVAEAALEIADPWDAVVFLFDRIQSEQSENRALGEVLLRHRGSERVAKARQQLAPATEKVLARAREAGKLRAGISAADVPVFGLMLQSVALYSREVSPELWRRYLALLLDGMRGNERTEALPTSALTDAELARVMSAPTR